MVEVKRIAHAHLISPGYLKKKELSKNSAEAEVSTHIGGDWTIARVAEHISSLMDFSAQQVEAVLKGIVVNVDCSRVDKIDLSGLQLLYVWMHCMNIKGFRTQFINMSSAMRELVQRMDVHTTFAAPQQVASA